MSVLAFTEVGGGEATMFLVVLVGVEQLLSKSILYFKAVSFCYFGVLGGVVLFCFACTWCY